MLLRNFLLVLSILVTIGISYGEENNCATKVLFQLFNPSQNQSSLALSEATHPVLRTPCQRIAPSLIPEPELQNFIDQLVTTMKKSGGVGIAAPQVGESLPIFVIQTSKESLVVINPKITSFSKNISSSTEGCLSLPGRMGLIRRPSQVTVEYTDRFGKAANRTLTGTEARIFQHEMDHLEGRLFTDFFDHPLKKIGISKRPMLTPDGDRELKKIVEGLTQEQENEFKAIADQLKTSLEESHTPYTSTSRLKGKTKSAEIEILDLYRSWFEDEKSRYKNLSDWIQSPNHVAVVYPFLKKMPKGDEILTQLIQHHPQLKDLAINHFEGKASLITYGFEKEGASNEIALCYKPAKYSDDEWFKLDREKQIKELKKKIGGFQKKFYQSENRVAPTSLKPEYLGPIQEELSDAAHSSFGWEVKSAGEEIRLNQLFKNMKDLSNTVKNERNFHVHQVFELPNNYKNFDEFDQWVKHLNDYVVLKGLENGMHPNYMIAIPGTNKIGFLGKIKNRFRVP